MNRQATDDEARTIEIPRQITEQIETRIGETEFETVDAYANFVLDRVLWELRRLDQNGEDGEVASSDDHGKEVADDGVAERLDALGYL